MKKNKSIPQTFIHFKGIGKLILFLVAVVMIIDACKRDAEIIYNPNDGLILNLKWNQAYVKETKLEVESGLMWVFSFLGADLPIGSMQSSLVWKGNLLQIDFSKLGFNDHALIALGKLLKIIKQSQEYKTMEGIDIGRFIMLTLNSTNHYYAITGASRHFSDFKINRVIDAKKAAIIESCVTLNSRLIEVPDSGNQNLINTFFIANECEGSIINGKQTIYEYETIELMPNGQFRFAIYNLDGNLILASNAAKTISGKPAKCLWCHEINIQPPFYALTPVNGYYSPEMFRYIVSKNMNFVYNYRKTLKTEIDYRKTQDHALAEFLYISFMEPSVERLSLEWNMNIAQVKSIMKPYPTHTNHEFPYSDSLYTRKDADLNSPFQKIQVPESAREESLYEPDLIK